jgi:ATP-dependent DNA helicase RecQ
MPEAPDATDLSAVTFIDVEADRSGRVLAIGAVRGEETLRVDPRAEGKGAAKALARLAGEGWLAGHNLLEFDLPHLARDPVGFTAGRRRRLDTLVLSMVAEPDRPSHALERDREEPGRIPDPVAHARRARERAAAVVKRLASIDPAAAGCLRRAQRGAAFRSRRSRVCAACSSGA